MTGSRKFAMVIVLILCLLDFSLVFATNKVQGDQDVGGIHLFEFHTLSGGVGMGRNIMMVVMIIILALYFYIRHRMRRYVRSQILPLTQVSRMAEPDD